MRRIVTRIDVLLDKGSEGAVAWGFPKSHQVVSEDDELVRVLKVGEQWQPLDLAWVADPFGVLLSNLRPERTVNPTPQQALEDARAVVQVGFGGQPLLEVAPDCDCWIKPAAPLQVRCACGTARLRVVALPR